MSDLAEGLPSPVAEPARRSWTGRLTRLSAFVGVFLVLGVLGWGLNRTRAGPPPRRPAPRLHPDRVRRSDRQARRSARPGGGRQLLGVLVSALPRGSRLLGEDLARLPGAGRSLPRRG